MIRLWVRFPPGAQRIVPLCGTRRKQMYKVYLLESLRDKKWYVGYTPSNVLQRLEKHNDGLVQSTKSFRPWRLIYCEVYINRDDATGREKFLKSGAGRKFLEKQLHNYLDNK